MITRDLYRLEINTMNNLEKLGIKYGTDKIGKHNYLPIYYDLFHNKSKRRGVKKVLEIGVAEGAGLRMFRDFFTNATIYGAEIDQNRVFKEERIEVIKCDQGKQEDLLNLVKKTGFNIDLVVDDGSHKPKDQLFTCLQLFSSMNKGAVYVIEDVADDTIFLPLKTKFPNCELKRVGKRLDDQLIICRN